MKSVLIAIAFGFLSCGSGSDTVSGIPGQQLQLVEGEFGDGTFIIGLSHQGTEPALLIELKILSESNEVIEVYGFEEMEQVFPSQVILPGESVESKNLELKDNFVKIVLIVEEGQRFYGISKNLR